MDRDDHLSEYVVNADKWDHEVASATHATDPEFAKEGRLLGRTVETAGPLWNDTFQSFYKAEPALLDDDEIRTDFRIDRSIMDLMTQVDSYDKLREFCMGDPYASADACVSMRETLEAIWDKLRLARETQKRLEEMYEQMAAAMAERAESEDDGTGQGEQDGEADGDAAGGQSGMTDEQLSQLQQMIADAEAQMKQEVAQQSGIVRHMFEESLEEAADEAEAMQMAQQITSSEPGNAAGKLVPLSYAQRKALAKLLKSDKVSRAFDLIGAMTKSLTAFNRERIVDGVEEIIDIELGNELSQVVLSEFVNLKHPLARLLFMKNYYGGTLQQYEMQGHEYVANGKIICCIDVSGSMSGEPDIWAKAVALTLLHQARKQGRDFVGILFDTKTHEFDFTGNQFSAEKVAAFITSFSGGGTNFMLPLDVARTYIEEEYAETGRTSADIVIITDDQCYVTDDWLTKWKESQEEYDFKTWGILVGASRFRDNSTIDTICDGRVMSASNMKSGEELELLWQGIE